MPPPPPENIRKPELLLMFSGGIEREETSGMKWNNMLDVYCVNLITRYDISCRVFFLSGFSFTDTDNSQDNRWREMTIFRSTLPLPPAHEQCLWDDYHIFLIALLVFTRLLLDEIYQTATRWDLPPYRITIWWLMWCWFSFVCLLIWLYVLLQLFDMRNRWAWTREPTNQVC